MEEMSMLPSAWFFWWWKRCFLFSFLKDTTSAIFHSFLGIYRLCLLWVQNSAKIQRCHNVHQFKQKKNTSRTHFLPLHTAPFLFIPFLKKISSKILKWHFTSFSTDSVLVAREFHPNHKPKMCTSVQGKRQEEKKVFVGLSQSDLITVPVPLIFLFIHHNY